MSEENRDVAELCHHGGNLDAARSTFPEVNRWVDLSTGINPVAYPVPAISATAWQRLPDASLNERLLSAAANYFRLSDAEGLIAAPGTQALLQVLPRVLMASRVDIVSPTYNEHAKCWRQTGALVREIATLGELDPTVDVAVVVNPNNPDGAVYSPEKLFETAELLARRGGCLIVDEAFCDVAPELSMTAYGEKTGLVVLRSFGKFFGLAGVRLGFALGEKSLLSRIGQELGPWAVSGPALEIGATAYSDEGWIASQRSRLKNDAARLCAVLETAGINVVGGTDLFVLASVSGAKDLWLDMARQGIWTRLFEYSDAWVRFGLPGDEADWQQLQKVLVQRCL